MGFRTLFDRRSREAACQQGAREASELNPAFSARTRKAPQWGFFVLGEGMGFRNLFDRRSREAAFGGAKRPSRLLRHLQSVSHALARWTQSTRT